MWFGFLMWVTGGVLSEEELKAILDSPIWYRVSFLPTYAYLDYLFWTELAATKICQKKMMGALRLWLLEISKPTQLKNSGTIWASRCIKPPTLGVYISGYEKCNLQNWTILTTTHDSACRYFLPACQNAMDFPFLLLICCDCLQGGNIIMFLNLKPFISLSWCLSCMWHLNWSHLTVKNKVLYVSQATDLRKHRIVLCKF